MCFGGGKPKEPTKLQANVVTVETDDNNCSEVLDIFTVTSEGTVVEPVYKTVKWGPVDLDMQMDTGSPVCIVSEETYQLHAKQWPALKPTNRELHCYLGKLPVSGVLHTTAQHQNYRATAELYVVQCPGPTLCGRDMIQKLHLLPDQEVGTILTLDSKISSVTEQLKEKFKDLFEPGTGLMKGPPASIVMKKDATPRFLKARSLPYALREKVGMELDRMCQQGILSPVSHSC